MNDNDNALAPFDLSAWDAPPPPIGLADAVIERMGASDVAVAVPPIDVREASRRTWIIAGVAVVVVALVLGVWSLAGSTHHAAPVSGDLVAERARSLTLDTVRADLDAGAEVRWQRKAGVLYVAQRAGRVAWRVDSGEKLVIDAGAATASVEATGANLRVEVQMNATDARVIGASMMTAAVAMITVVVYEGHVNVSRPGQPAVVVAPGSTLQISPPEEQPPPIVVETVNTVDTNPGRKKLAILGLGHVVSGASGDESRKVTQRLGSMLRLVADVDGPYELAPIERELVDEKLRMNCVSEAVLCMAAIGASLGVDVLVFGNVEAEAGTYRVAMTMLDVGAKAMLKTRTWVIPEAQAEGNQLRLWGVKIYSSLVSTHDEPKSASLDRPAITATMKRIEPEILGCSEQENVGGEITVRVQVYPDGSVSQAEVIDAASYELQTCVVGVVRETTFPATTNGGAFSYPYVLPEKKATATTSNCDPVVFKDKALENINTGQHAAALAQLEASLACKDDPYVRQLAFMEACSSSNSAKAKQYYKQLTPTQQATFAMICERQNVVYTDDVVPASPSLPEGLDRLSITSVMARIRPDVLACGTKFKVGGKVKLKVQVNPAGTVRSVEIVDVSKPELGECVAHVVQTATFAATQKGGSFSYPFMLPEL